MTAAIAEPATAGVPITQTDDEHEQLVRDHVGRYLAAGWAVVPLHGIRRGHCTCGRPDCSSPGKHPIAQLARSGLKDATTDPATVDYWLDNAPWMNVGLPTGRDAGFVVVDVDAGHGGLDALAELEATYGSVPDTRRALTGGGGVHVLFQHPGVELRNSASRIGRGIDVRGDGGYIVAPPSRHAAGTWYVWDDEAAPLLPLPRWLLARAQAEPAQPRPVSFSARHGDARGLINWSVRKYAEPTGEGSRNARLAAFGGSLRRLGADETEIAERLLAHNRTLCSPPLPEGEVLKVARSVSRYTPGVLA